MASSPEFVDFRSAAEPAPLIARLQELDPTSCSCSGPEIIPEGCSTPCGR